MHALVEILGKQYKVHKDDEILVDLLDNKDGDKVSFNKVLAIIDGDKCTFGTPYISGATVEAEVLSTEKGEKVRVYKYHRRKGYRRTQGHRESYSKIKVLSVKG